MLELLPQDGPPPFGPAVTRAGLHINLPVYEKTSTAGWTLKDISAARFTYVVRAWVLDVDTTFVFNEAITKSATASWLDYYLALGTTPRSALQWQISEIDNDNSDASTVSAKRERVLARWKQAVLDAPT